MKSVVDRIESAPNWEAAVDYAIGGASTCWDDLGNAGTLGIDRAMEIRYALVNRVNAHIAALPERCPRPGGCVALREGRFEVDGVDFSGDVDSVTLRAERYFAPPSLPFGEAAPEVNGERTYVLHISHALPMKGMSELQLLAFQMHDQMVEYAFWPNDKPGPKFSGRALVKDSINGGLSFEWPCEERPALIYQAHPTWPIDDEVKQEESPTVLYGQMFEEAYAAYGRADRHAAGLEAAVDIAVAWASGVKA